jgi:hypothetical protein
MILKERLIQRLYVHPLSDYELGELESMNTSDLEHLLLLLDAQKERQSQAVSEGGFIRRQRRGDEPPELDEDDERILDGIWGQIAEEEGAGDAN